MTVQLFGIIIDITFLKGVVTMRDNPKPFEIFKHFKGKQYQILALAKDSGDGRDMVVYQALYGDYIIYVRDLSEFMSPVDKIKYPDASQEYRFEKQGGMTAAAETEQDTKRVPGQSARQGEEQEPEQGAGQGAEQEPEQGAGQGVEQGPEQSTEQRTEQVTEQEAKQAEGDSREEFLDPVIVEFLDAESVYDKLNILAGLHHRITDDMLEIMAAASDIELNKGSTQEKYAELKNCLLMMEKYECKRIR